MGRDRVVTRSGSCERCRAAVYWARTEGGEWVPLEPAAEPGPAGNFRLGPRRQPSLLDAGEDTGTVAVRVDPGAGSHRHHRVTCPAAAPDVEEAAGWS